MAAGKQPDGGRPGKPATRDAGGRLVRISTVVVASTCIGFGVAGCDSGGADVPAPTAVERGDTVPILQRSFASQGICYGWQLEDSGEVVSVGSNLGGGVSASTEDSRCPRWVEVIADIRYTSESSEANDWATVYLNGSSDFRPRDLTTIQLNLGRFGLTNDVFLDDPGWAITRAAVTVPLLMAEAGLTQPAAVPAASPVASVAPLPDAGTDLWRDRRAYLIATGALLLVTALFVTVGLVQRRRQLRAAVPAQRPEADRARSRTRESA
ncbi:hypothetical protein ACFY2R_00520 [Micromonospora olivasterospora]|uniref:Uncharacterized protein n=1 Tax=Micromonospora olivasterospora TaxID=1880 RepID=A0A562I9Q7_MICOL|nr:hypothetical protein [Micromonospora olivasterospora]TWH67622.1 hypothetical protein JD77_02602 [Micromonospora olivasterospora]